MANEASKSRLLANSSVHVYSTLLFDEISIELKRLNVEEWAYTEYLKFFLEKCKN
jgi:hypothetical protein